MGWAERAHLKAALQTAQTVTPRHMVAAGSCSTKAPEISDLKLQISEKKTRKVLADSSLRKAC
jgi:hypothetical protein